KRLFNVQFLINSYKESDESFRKILENSLIKHANSIQHFKIDYQPTTKIISSFVNLNRLELDDFGHSGMKTWNCLENLPLPFLQNLKAKRVPIKGLASLIENTNGYLIEINIDTISFPSKFNSEIDYKKIIQAIYQNCPNLRYLNLMIRNNSILEL